MSTYATNLSHQALVANRVELVEFGDFVCPKSRAIRKALTTSLALFTGYVHYTYRHYPNPACEPSLLAAYAAEAAREQDKFWSMYNALFLQPTINQPLVSILAIYLGLDHHQFQQDLTNASIRARIDADRWEGEQLGIHSTPALLINGHVIHGKLTQARLIPLLRHYIDRTEVPILSTVDRVRGMVHWNDGE